MSVLDISSDTLHSSSRTVRTSQGLLPQLETADLAKSKSWSGEDAMEETWASDIGAVNCHMTSDAVCVSEAGDADAPVCAGGIFCSVPSSLVLDEPEQLLSEVPSKGLMKSRVRPAQINCPDQLH